MHPTFLVIEEAVKDSFANRLMDQAFSIVLLVSFAVYSLRRQKQIEDKLEKYMSEDREEMKEVIINNTKAFERIATKFAVLVISFLILPSCVSRKVSTSVNQKDSTTVNATARSDKTAYQLRERLMRDTSLNIRYRSVTGTLSAGDLKPLFTSDGQPVENVNTFRGDRITGTVRSQPDGTVKFECAADSLTLVITNLITQKDSLAFTLDATTRYALTRISKSETEKVTVRTKTINEMVGWFILVAFGGAIVYLILKRFTPL